MVVVYGILIYEHAYPILAFNMPKTKVTEKFQITIPKEVREEVDLKPGEVVVVEKVSGQELRVKRFRMIKDPLSVLVGKKPFNRHVPVEEFEEKAEAR